ncbi:MAG: radical SAM protein [Endomicrobia bacterium]|nr:radical SAM protein [Endomicrobiia bacterium]
MNKKVSLLKDDLFFLSFQKRIPIYSTFEITYRCNLRCKHCYIPDNFRNIDELSNVQIKQVIKQLYELGGIYLVITGGEPLLKCGIYNIIEYSKNLNFAVILFSNGSLINRYVAKNLYVCGVDKVEISLYGDEKTHNEFVGSKVFNKTLSAIEHLKCYGINVCLKTVLTKENYFCYSFLENLCKNFEVPLKVDFVITPKIDGDFSNVFLNLSKEGMLKFLVKKDFKVSKKVRKDFKNLICSAGFNLLSINPKGEVFPCLSLPYKLGDVKKDSLRNIWSTNVFVKNIMKKKQYRGCFSCEQYKYCNRCVGLCYVESGNLFGCCSIMKETSKIYSELY